MIDLFSCPLTDCVVIRFAGGRLQYIVGVRFIEPDITGLMNQDPTLRHSLLGGLRIAIKLIMINTIHSLRPKQWAKNLFIFLPLVFGKKINIFPDNLKTVIAFFLFSIAAGVVYLINDMIDIEKDKLHPVKSKRCIASGKVSSKHAVITALILAGISIVFSFMINVKFGWIITAYIASNFLYTKYLKDVVIVDVFCIVGFFLMRILAGSVIADVQLSYWIVFITLFLALFMGLNKRRQELKLFEEDAANHRIVLEKYSVRFIDQMIAVVAPSIVVMYALYVVDGRTVAKFGSDHLIYTIPFVVYGVFRYLYLIHVLDWDGDPTTILFSDRKMQVNLVLWFISCVGIIYF